MWLSKNEILNISKPYIFWGSGAWVEKTIKSLGIYPEFIIDINENIQGTKQLDIDIISYDEVDLSKYFIIITTGSYKSVIEFLDEKNIKSFSISPSLYNLSIRDNIINIDRNILFSVPSEKNGGLYIYNTLKKSLKKIFSGNSRGLARSKNYIVLADVFKGLVLFDKNLNIIKTAKLLPNSFCHGVAISEEREKIFVANAARDSISVYDLNSFEHIKEIAISTKCIDMEEEQHHINDLYIDSKSNKLLISMFSFSGRWREGVYDGGVLEYDLKTNKLSPYPIISNLWMPHSVNMFDNSIVVLDSMRGDLYKSSNKVIGKFAGFIRGVDYDGEYFYLAQSTTRYFDRLEGVSLNIPLNCGIYIFDEKTKASFFHTFYEFENIHSVVLL